MTTALTIIELTLAAAALVAVVRIVRGPSLADRMVALDLLLLLVAGGFAIEAARSGSTALVPVVVVVTLVAFVGTLVVARFIEWRDT